MIRGEFPQKIIKDMQKALNSSEYATRRLVMTESAFFASASRKETYDKLEVKQYKILAVLDTKTSTICRDMDGKVFDVKDYQPGMNANPFHANCRTTTTPYFNDKFAQQQERSVRDENGKTYYVPTNITYKEWYNKYVKDNQNVSVKDNTILKQQKQSIDTVESLHNQQMKQLEEMVQQQKEQLVQLQNVINQQKQQLYANNIEIFKMESTKQLEKLTDQQKQAIKEYTGNSAYEINRRIAKGKDLGKYKQQFDLLHTALSQCEITSDIIVQRKTILEHLNIPNEIVQQIKKNKNFIALLKNKIVVNKTFTSTSLIDFDYPPRNVIVKIKIPKGFKGGVYIKDIAYKKYQNQEEVLFDVGLIYKIVSVKIIDNKYYLEAEVIP